MLPMCLGKFRYGDEVIPEIDGFYPHIEIEERFCKGGACYQEMIFPGEMNTFIVVVVVVVVFFFAIGNVNFAQIWISSIGDAATGIVVTKNKSTVGDEFQAFGIGRGGGLDEEKSSLLMLYLHLLSSRLPLRHRKGKWGGRRGEGRWSNCRRRYQSSWMPSRKTK